MRGLSSKWMIGIVLAHILVCASGCSGCLDTQYYQGPDGWPDDTLPGNRAPILDPVGTYTVEEGQLLRIILSVYDPDGDRLVYRAAPLPEGAQFDTEHGVFTWTPAEGAALNSPYLVEFWASDGQLEAQTTGTFIVEAGPVYVYDVIPERIPQRGGTEVTLIGIGFEAPATATIAGTPVSQLTVVDETTLTFITPPLPALFGKQTLILLFPNERRAVLENRLFVYTDDARFTGSVRRYALPFGTTVWNAGDVDGDLVDEVIAGHNSGVTLVDLDQQPTEFTELLEDRVDALAVGHFDRDSGAGVALQTSSGSVFAAFSGDPASIYPLHQGDPPAIALALFDLEGDGDDEVLVVDEQGDRWVYPALSGGSFGEPIISTGVAIPRRIQVADLVGDSTGDLLLEFSDSFGIAIGVETGMFLLAGSIEDSIGFRQPVPVWDEPTSQWRITALADASIGIFVRDASDRWRLENMLDLPQGDGLASDRYLLDLTASSALDVVSIPSEAPGIRIDQQRAEHIETQAWYMVGPAAGPPLLADLNADGLPEILLLDPNRPEAIAISPHPGSDELDAPQGVYMPGGRELLVGDFLSNGYIDLVVTGVKNGPVTSHLLIQGYTGGRFSDTPLALPAHADVDQVVLADLTGDGYVEVVSSGDAAAVYCYPSLAYAVFGPRRETLLPNRPEELIALARFGTTPLVGIRFDEGPVVLMESQQGCQLAAVQDILSGALLIRAADIDGDQWSELVVLDRLGVLSVFDAVNSETYEQTRGITLSTTDVADFSVGAVIGDQPDDVVMVGPHGVALVENALSGLPSQEVVWHTLDTTPASQVVLADLNGDGCDETIVTAADTPPRTYWWRDDFFETRELPDWHTGALSAVAADLDRDQDIDVVTLLPEFGPVIWLNDAAP